MTRIPLSSSAVALICFLVLAAPVSPAGQGVRERGTASIEGQAVPRSEPRHGAPVQAPPAAQAEPQRVTEPARPEATTRVPPVRRTDFPNANATAVPRPTPRVVMPQVVVPQVVQPQVEILRPNDHPDYWPNYRPDYRPQYQPYYQPYYRPLYRPDYRPYYRPYYRPHYRPYYTFLPRYPLGFGLWIGYPVRYPTYFYPYTPYPYAYTYPYPNTSPYPTATYPAPGIVGAAGGLSFEITPPEAGVYVDGLYIGVVGQFTPNQPPLALAPGRHHVEIREPGFEIIAFDVDILPGQVIPYRGELRRF